MRLYLSNVEAKSWRPRTGSGDACDTVADDTGHGSCRQELDRLVRRSEERLSRGRDYLE